MQIYGFHVYIFGSFNAMKTKIPRSIQCNNMSSFIAIVLVDVNIITTYEPGFESQASSCIIKLRNCLNKNID